MTSPGAGEVGNNAPARGIDPSFDQCRGVFGSKLCILELSEESRLEVFGEPSVFNSPLASTAAGEEGILGGLFKTSGHGAF